ncbi:MAG: hypothetical protein ACSLFF_06760 [Solirubrobacterales bacterium]
MNENTPPEGGTTEPEAPTQPIAPASDTPPSWALDKFKRNTVIGGAAVVGAMIALAGAALVGDYGWHGRGDHRGGLWMMQGGPGNQGGPGMRGDGWFEQRGPGAQGQGYPTQPNQQNQQDDEGQTDKSN